MDVDIRYKIIEEIEEVTRFMHLSEEALAQGDLANLGLDSMLYVKLVVRLESEFDIDFDDEMLVFGQLINIDQLYKYIVEKMKSENINYDPGFKMEKRKHINKDLKQILLKYTNANEINDLLLEEMHLENADNILNDINEKYGLNLVKSIILSNGIKSFDDLCDFVYLVSN